MMLEPITFINNNLSILDQRKLPFEIAYIPIKCTNDLIEAIKNLSVRGAPLLGLCGLYGLFFASSEENIDKFLKHAELVRNARPTAVNLSKTIDENIEIIKINNYFDNDLLKIRNFILKSLVSLEIEIKKSSELISKNGLTIINDNDRILTHCNTGTLAVGGSGTALGIIKLAHKEKKGIEVLFTETRPLFQGSRLTSIELLNSNIPSTLIIDSSVGYFMQKGEITKVVVGADRIAKNGDTANKIGTYNIAVLAKYHNIPFFIAAPDSTYDLSLDNGEQIVIEFRDSDEIKKMNNINIAPEETGSKNPAFDITPRELITAIITESGINYL